MIIKNGLVFRNHSFVKSDVKFDKTIEAVEEKIDVQGEEIVDADGCYVVPGFVDIHTHGAMGEDFSNCPPEAMEVMSEYYAKHGVTSFLATTMTLPEDTLAKAMNVIKNFKPERGARCAGVHLEGPFLSSAKKGAQAGFNLHAPDADMFDRLNEAAGGMVRLVTVACEEPGAFEFIRNVSKKCTVSLGHTAADYDTAMEGFRCGATHATHLFNGMNPMLHRQPGVVAAAFDSGASVELICDGIHIHPACIRLTHKLFGDKLNLISDSLRCAGMPDGKYELGGQYFDLKNGLAKIEGTDTLAGSTISLIDAVQRVVKFGLPLEDAVYSASTAPADAVGLSKIGRIENGAAADLLILDKELNIKAVYRDGLKLS